MTHRPYTAADGTARRRPLTPIGEAVVAIGLVVLVGCTSAAFFQCGKAWDERRAVATASGMR